MKTDFRCICPLTSAIDIVGDKWTLVIIKQMLLEGKQTFKDFTESDESIASNILSSRLKMLEEFKLITKEKLLHNKKNNIYLLTEKGLALIPTIVELTLWSDENLREFHPGLYTDDRLKMAHKDKEEFVKTLAKNYKKENWQEHYMKNNKQNS
jgi:DNA-binding HxlR family transcriptional regulator